MQVIYAPIFALASKVQLVGIWRFVFPAFAHYVVQRFFFLFCTLIHLLALQYEADPIYEDVKLLRHMFRYSKEI